jgi:hypothetical protein
VEPKEEERKSRRQIQIAFHSRMPKVGRRTAKGIPLERNVFRDLTKLTQVINNSDGVRPYAGRNMTSHDLKQLIQLGAQTHLNLECQDHHMSHPLDSFK